MTRIAIVTDSSCDLPDELLKEHNIHLLPLKIIYKDAEFRDRVDIRTEEIYERFSEEIPKTSLPSPEDALTLFEDLAQQGYTHILGVFISSGLSGTFNMVRTVTSDFSQAVVELVDSKNLSLAVGFPVLEAARELARSNDFERVVERAREAVTKSKTFFVIKTLEYLRKGGRIGLVEGTIGDLLNIKPIVSVNPEGVYYTFRKVRGRAKSIQEIYQIAVDEIQNRRVSIGVLHGNAIEEAMELVHQFKSMSNVKEVLVEQLCSSLAVHTGPGLLGVVVAEAYE